MGTYESDSAPPTFQQLLARVRDGDRSAAERLMQDYEDAVRRVVRVRLTSPMLRRQFDSMDVCQSVMMRFYVSIGLGQFDLNSPEDLVRLLAKMAGNRIREIARAQRAARRDVRQLDSADVADLPLADNDPTPSEFVCNRELLETVLQRLSERDRYLGEQRMKNRSWIEIGHEMSVPPDTLRIAFSRAVNRVIRELRLD